MSGIGCYGFCLVLLVLANSRVRLGLFAYLSCFLLFWFCLCRKFVSALYIVWHFNIPVSWRPGATQDVGMLTVDLEK